MTFLHYVSLHLEEPNLSGRLPLGREWSWLLLQLRDAESEVWMLLGSWSRAMYRGFHRFVPWATNYRDTHRVIGTLRTYIFFFAQKNMLLQFTFVYVPAEICGHKKIIILLCLRQKTVPSIYFCLRPRWDLRTSKNNSSALPQTKDCSEILEAVCVSTFFQEYETYHSYLMKDCTSVRVEMR